MTWQNDVNYSNARHGVEKIITFPTIALTVAGIQGKIVMTEDIVVTEVGSWITTDMSTSAPCTVTISDSGAEATVAVLSIPTLTAAAAVVGVANVQTTITNPTSLVSGDTMILTVSNAASQAGVATVYVKYRSEFN